GQARGMRIRRTGATICVNREISAVRGSGDDHRRAQKGGDKSALRLLHFYEPSFLFVDLVCYSTPVGNGGATWIATSSSPGRACDRTCRAFRVQAFPAAPPSSVCRPKACPPWLACRRPSTHRTCLRRLRSCSEPRPSSSQQQMQPTSHMYS